MWSFIDICYKSKLQKVIQFSHDTVGHTWYCWWQDLWNSIFYRSHGSREGKYQKFGWRLEAFVHSILLSFILDYTCSLLAGLLDLYCTTWNGLSCCHRSGCSIFQHLEQIYYCNPPWTLNCFIEIVTIIKKKKKKEKKRVNKQIAKDELSLKQ